MDRRKRDDIRKRNEERNAGDTGVLGDLNDRLIEVKCDAKPIPPPTGENPAP